MLSCLQEPTRKICAEPLSVGPQHWSSYQKRSLCYNCREPSEDSQVGEETEAASSEPSVERPREGRVGEVTRCRRDCRATVLVTAPRLMTLHLRLLFESGSPVHLLACQPVSGSL